MIYDIGFFAWALREIARYTACLGVFYLAYLWRKDGLELWGTILLIIIGSFCLLFCGMNYSSRFKQTKPKEQKEPAND